VRFALPERRMLSIMGYDFDDAGRDGGSPRRAGDKAEPYQPKQANGPDATTGEEQRKPSRIKLVPFEEICLGTERPYLVKGLIPHTGLTVIWGPPKSGKSFWTFDLAMHVALGWDYRGRRVQQGAVVYCAFEGQSGIKKRVEAFRLRHLVEGAEGAPFYLQPVILDLVKDCGELIAAVSLALGDTKPTAVVLDTLNRSLHGSESSDEDMSAYIRAADAIREAFDCAVLIVHHCGVNDSRPRGHTSLTGAVDAQLAVKRDADGNIIVTVEWMKDGESEGDTIASRLEVVEVGSDEDDEAITSCIVVPSEIMATTTKPSRLANSAKIARDCLIDVLAREGKVPPINAHIPEHTPTVSEAAWRADCYARGISKGVTPRAHEMAFANAAQSLQAKGMIGRWNGECWIIQ
jgi:hypothetical protein